MELNLKSVRTKRDWENPQIQHKNRLESRAYFVPFKNKEAYQNGENLNENFMSLNGQWDFLYLEAPEYSPKGFYNSDFNLADFKKIKVPSCWQLEGYGNMRYIDELYPFHVDPPYVPMDNPTGIYKRKFVLTNSWSKERTILRLHGVDSFFEIWVNGQEIGMGKISRLLSEFDISSAVTEGENEITIRVIQWSDGSYLEDQDMWWLTGIFRDIELVRQPQIHVQDVIVSSKLNNSFTNAVITANIFIKGTEEAEDISLDVSLLDKSSSEGKEEVCKFVQTQMQVSEGGINYIMQCELSSPKLWSAEEPNLYLVAVKLSDTEFIAVETGLRNIEVVGNQFLVNGKAIMLNGINRHDVNCKNGRTVSKEDMLWDVLTMKRHNINAVRTSHYPNHPYFYHLCNMYGLYVIDETDLECHGFMDLGYWNWLSNSKEWTKAYVSRCTGMLKRDRNHPCIIMWSLGNESGFGYNFNQMAQAIRKLDDSRLLHYEGDFNGAITDVYSTMYSRMPGLNKIGARNEEMPFIICEYCHSMGNGPGALKEHQEIFRKYDRMQGGFIWEWIDHGIECTDENGNLFYKYGGDYGEYPNNSNFCMDGMVFPWREPSPALLEFKKVIQPVEIKLVSSSPSVVSLKNLYDFSSLSHLDLVWSCKANGIIISNGRIDSKELENILPGDIKNILLETNLEKISSNTEYRLEINLVEKENINWAEKGHIIAWEDLELDTNDCQITLRPVAEKLKISEDEMQLVISGHENNTEIIFDKFHGVLKSYNSNNTAQITDGININFWRAPIDNDMYVGEDRKSKFFMHKFESCPHGMAWEQEEDFVSVRILQRAAPISQAYGYDILWDYIIYNNGDIKLNLSGNCVHTDKNAPEDFPKIGLEIIMSAENNSVTWYGRGPGENYVDTKSACSIGCYTAPVSAMHTPYPFPQENGNRSDVRWAGISGENSGLMFMGISKPFDLTVHDYTKENLDKAKHLNELKKCDKTIVSLDYFNSGVGSNSCGQGPLDEHKAKFEDFNFIIELRPYKNSTELESLAKIKYE